MEIAQASTYTVSFMNALIFLVLQLWMCEQVVCDNMNQGKHFGEGWPHLRADETDIFPSVDEFINKYVSNRRPLIVRGGAKISPAFGKWTDDYLLSLNVPKDNEVLVETLKKESRTQETKMLHFHEFIRVYNESELYMVESIPDFLKDDITVPCPLRCPGIEMVDAVVWYSSGGTKSVVHTDSVDNLNCLYRGHKDMILVDAAQKHDVDLDHPDGSYSSVNVDSVDYTKFPGLAKVDYYNVSLNAGDCFYIPYLWIHQVRSYGSNLAVNIWWDHFSVSNIDVKECARLNCNLEFTLKKCIFKSFEDMTWSEDVIRDRLLSVIGVHDFATLDRFKKYVFKYDYINNEDIVKGAEATMREVFKRFDKDNDGKMTKKEVHACSRKDWSWVMNVMKKMEQFIKKMDNEGDAGAETADMEHEDVDESENEAENVDGGNKYREDL